MIRTIEVTPADVAKTQRILADRHRYPYYRYPLSSCCPVAQACRRVFKHKKVQAASGEVCIGGKTWWRPSDALSRAIRDFDRSNYKEFRTGVYAICR